MAMTGAVASVEQDTEQIERIALDSVKPVFFTEFDFFGQKKVAKEH